MISGPKFKKKFEEVQRLMASDKFDAALRKVESLMVAWPGNAHLHVLWATLAQLQENPKGGLDEVRQSLEEAVELDQGSPAAALEFGYYLDNVEDAPEAAIEVFTSAVSNARRLLTEGLIGQARALIQLGKWQEVSQCLEELFQLVRFDPSAKKTENRWWYVFTRDFLARNPKLAFKEEIEELLEALILEYADRASAAASSSAQ